MSFPKAIVLLLAGSIVYSHAAENRSVSKSLDEVIMSLQQNAENPAVFKSISFTLQLSADPSCSIGSLRPIIVPLFTFMETEQKSGRHALESIAALGSPCKELVAGVGDKTNIHGSANTHLGYEQDNLVATFTLQENPADDCDQQAWATIVKGCIDFLVRCSQANFADENSGLSVFEGTLHDLLACAVHVPALCVRIKLEFKLSDDQSLYAEFVKG